MINTVKIQENGYLVNGTMSVPQAEGNRHYKMVQDWIAEGNIPEPMDIPEVQIPQVVTMRQARLALLQEGLLATIESAIQNGTDEAMKIEWEYATEVRRDWASLVTLTESLGMTSAELDSLFTIASTL